VAAVLDSNDAPLLNRALANYNLGSVFKVVVAAAALEAGYTTGTAFACDGALSVGGTVFHCHNRLGHGVLDMQGAMAQSCNCYFIQLAQAVGGQALYDMAVSLGFDSSLILADNIRTARAVQPAATELTGAALANFSIGQGALLATPVHIAQLMSAVVGGGRYVRPSVVRGTVNAAGQVTELQQDAPTTAFSKETAVMIVSMLRKVVSEGTGGAALPEKGGAGGKTGTAETGWVVDGYTVSQSWFAGFYPAYAPQYVVVVLSEDAGQTGVKAAGVFREICDALCALE
jgi:penicillin-binding protein 2